MSPSHYDGDGNRVSETAGGVTTEYLVDTLNPTGLPQVLEEIVNGSVTRAYAYGLRRISENQKINGTWTPSFYGYDGHGNVRFLASTAGAVTDTYQFDAFGNQIASTGTTPNNYLFSGEQFDNSTGLYQLRARWYRPTVGRFITRDPVEGQPCSPLTLNPYVYAGDDPVDRVDPTGAQAIVEYALLLGSAPKAPKFHMLDRCPCYARDVHPRPPVPGSPYFQCDYTCFCLSLGPKSHSFLWPEAFLSDRSHQTECTNHVYPSGRCPLKILAEVGTIGETGLEIWRMDACLITGF